MRSASNYAENGLWRCLLSDSRLHRPDMGLPDLEHTYSSKPIEVMASGGHDKSTLGSPKQ